MVVAFAVTRLRLTATTSAGAGRASGRYRAPRAPVATSIQQRNVLACASSRFVGYDDAIPRKKICPCPGTDRACDGRSGERIVCCYLGIDTPPLPFHAPEDEPSRNGAGGKVDTAEFLSAVGTFLAAMTAFVSVGVIVLREDPHIFWTIAIMAGWVVGVMMQIIAGAITRIRT